MLSRFYKARQAEGQEVGASAPSAQHAFEVTQNRATEFEPAQWDKNSRKRNRCCMTEIVSTRQFVGRRTASIVNGTSRFVPEKNCRPLDVMDERLYCSKWSTSGNILLSACQDASIRLYRAADVDQWSQEPQTACCSSEGGFGGDGQWRLPRGGRRTRAGRTLRSSSSNSSGSGSGSGGLAGRHFKEIVCRNVGWSVISTDFSGDEKWLAYSSWSEYVHLCNTGGDYELHEALNFEPDVNDSHFCLFSIQFSPRNTHIAGGGSDNRVYLANLERKEVTARMCSHGDHVNTVAFADDSGHLLLSGSDDCTIKVWDVREHRKPVGCMTGHQGGLTCVTPRGDGRYFISNGKDQVLKLWDLRSMLSDNDPTVRAASAQSAADYRWGGGLSAPRGAPRGFSDLSVRSFRGHRVLQTLIRCYFSPQHSTGQKYIISGSQDGQPHIWDSVTGELLSMLHGHSNLVRDVAWHPHLPLIATSSWDCTLGLWRV